MRALLRLLFVVSVLFPGAAPAQEFPAKPIKLIVPFPPGGPNDIIARAVGQRMSEIAGQPVTIDNRGGAAGVLGTDAVAKAEPDGYTIAITSAGALAISASLQEKLPYDSTKDLKAITLVAKVPEMLVLASSVPASTMGELVALAKAKPGQLDLSPKGDAAGFVQVIDENTLAFPDRSGNRRIDSFRNILQNPNVGLIFFVPGETETLRAAGKAMIVRDAALRQSMALDGRIPELATVIRVERAYFHCGKCIARSKLWDRDNDEGVPAPRNGWQRVLGRKRVSR